MRIVLVAFLVSLVLSSPALAEPVIKGTPGELTQYLSGLPDTVQISARADYKFQPDKAFVQVAVQTEDKTLKDALEQNRELRLRIVKNLVLAGIPESDITGSKFSSTPRYGFWTDKPKGYRVVNMLEIGVENEAQFQAVAGEADANEGAYFHEVVYREDDPGETEQRLMDLLFKELERKKSFYEKNLGVRLTPKSFQDAVIRDPSKEKRYYGGVAGEDYKPEAPSGLFGERVLRGEITVVYLVERP